MPGVRLLERARLDRDAFGEAGLPDARGLAILNEDDLGNVQAAMRAQEVRPGIRLVIAIFNAGLRARIGSFFPNCAALSQAQTVAPSLVAAALGEPAPSQPPNCPDHVRRPPRAGTGRPDHLRLRREH